LRITEKLISLSNIGYNLKNREKKINSSELKLPSNRKFGIFFSIIFGLFAIYFYINSSYKIALFFIGFAVTFSMLALIKPSFLQILNKLWMNFGVILGRIVSPIIMGIIFFGMFTPIAVILRIFGRDELQIKHFNSYSYWKDRDKDSNSKEKFKHQF
tara:strand:- start:519 stop:989 length:471 start_codon:yes stop_codon:yes gene_type:complete